ncbi:hypothetical protein ABZX12_11565 [Kribbella sp. NPDC003505]|uniref:hypothetical protein n=1 Tax=Kribbella sp. NPDC003505 TaxID=3154448 RepID=UPI0033BC468F
METTRATRRLATSPFKQPVPAPIKTFEIGGRVSHDKEGIGRITAVEGAEAVVVDLGKGRLLRVMAPFHKLHTL